MATAPLPKLPPELRPKRRRATEPMWRYVRRLKHQRRAKQLGAGYYSTVFAHPDHPNVVVKVVPARDKGYLQYVRWAARHQGNPYVPRLLARYEVRARLGKRRSVYHLVFMERLEPLGQRPAKQLAALFGDAAALNRLEGESVAAVTSMLRAALRDARLDAQLAEVVRYLLRQHEHIDLHRWNFMRRGKQLVIVDPLFFTM
jgi:hypothetical protein